MLMVRCEKTENTKGVIRSHESKKDKQYTGQKKNYKRTNNDLKNIHIKLKIEHTITSQKARTGGSENYVLWGTNLVKITEHKSIKQYNKYSRTLMLRK